MKDLAIIGGGPGGYVAAIRAAQLGMSVCLVERDSLGGTCLNRGCIPTKAYYQNAALLRMMKRLSEFNLSADNISFDLPGARARKERIVAQIAGGIKQLLQANQIEVIPGRASLATPDAIMVDGRRIEAGKIMIATGSAPALLPLSGADLPAVVTSDQILDLTAVPQRLAIIGAGVIGMELAGIFSSFGSQVTVLEFQPNILGRLDHELVKRLGVYLRKQGIAVHTQTEVKKIEADGDCCKIIAEDKQGSQAYEADLVLVAAGRRPVTAGLGLEELGVSCHGGGFIEVDANYQTNVPGIYAIGDVVGRKMLAHVASEEGIVAVERMCGVSSRLDYEAVPGCIFTFPEIATVGLSQEEAAARGEYSVGKFPFAANGKAVAMGETDGLVKVIAAADGRVLGIHIIGPQASDLIQEAALIVANRLQLADVIATVHPHPTLGEALHEAAMDACGRAIHQKPRH